MDEFLGASCVIANLSIFCRSTMCPSRTRTPKTKFMIANPSVVFACLTERRNSDARRMIAKAVSRLLGRKIGCLPERLKTRPLVFQNDFQSHQASRVRDRIRA